MKASVPSDLSAEPGYQLYTNLLLFGHLAPLRALSNSGITFDSLQRLRRLLPGSCHKRIMPAEYYLLCPVIVLGRE
jgi:hypothetical protein